MSAVGCWLRRWCCWSVRPPPLLASAVQASWGLTPGKKLFQIRVVDRHGLVPSQATLAARMVFQMLPLWAGALSLGLQILGADILLALAGLAIAFTVIVDSALALVRRDRRSLHDVLFDTRVVLDVPGRSDAKELTRSEAVKKS